MWRSRSLSTWSSVCSAVAAGAATAAIETSAKTLMATVRKHYADDKDGGYFFVSDDHEALLARSKQPFDGPIPSRKI